MTGQDYDDILEELEIEFQKTLKVAHQEYRAGKPITLKDYVQERLKRRAG